MTSSLEGWKIHRDEHVGWAPWGSDGKARSKLLGDFDGYYVAVVNASAGHRGDVHVHTHAECLYVVDGIVQSQGTELTAGDGYVASPGSSHDDFGTLSGATYLSIFKL